MSQQQPSRQPTGQDRLVLPPNPQHPANLPIFSGHMYGYDFSSFMSSNHSIPIQQFHNSLNNGGVNNGGLLNQSQQQYHHVPTQMMTNNESMMNYGAANSFLQPSSFGLSYNGYYGNTFGIPSYPNAGTHEPFGSNSYSNFYPNHNYGSYQLMQPPSATSAKDIENALKSLLLGESKSEDKTDKLETQQPTMETPIKVLLPPTRQDTEEPNDMKTEEEINSAKEPTKKLKKKQTSKKPTFNFGPHRDSLTSEMKNPPEKFKSIDNFLNTTYTQSLLKLYNSELLPTQKELEKKEEFFKTFEKAITNKWGDAKLFTFGSYANGLSLRGNSDIDFCFILPLTPERMRKNFKEIEKERKLIEEQKKEATGSSNRFMKLLSEEQYHKKNYVSQLAQFLESKLHYSDVQGIFTARIPIVKFTEPTLKLHCDVGVNNILAVYNTKLVGVYCDTDIRCRQLIFFLKLWIKQRCINDPYGGTLSSYTLTLMIIHFLQLNGVLPYLQDKSIFTNITSRTVDGMDGNMYDCSFEESKEEIFSKFSQPNTDSVGLLLFKFFKYYAFEFDFKTKVISIRQSAQPVIPQEEKNFPQTFKVEDPFEIDFNTAKSVTKEGFKAVRYECIRAFYLIQKQANFKDVVCARLTN
ncbi:hypothetical protein C9374_003060 [Naegleria lovaniensis]|uniref:RNA uridylyltransferase n=1 Tax=Naegleria lovaniensis TaxID=51637 RepID=A0AA88GU93_NAELO|nr:uncharacterized protein C9374_003060 [Naegleria lovaniensis]KAG2385911.1 hypothetical protein C9374_003060 [Naegleria lovaniensis]